jgi:glycosyltransferase involved in cell wall biosynthesis
VQPLEIHHFIYQVGIGGAEHVAINLAVHQSVSGHDVTLWTAGGAPTDPEACELLIKYTEFLKDGGVVIRALPYGPRSIIGNGWFLRKHFRQYSTKNLVLHAHSPVAGITTAIANFGFRILNLHSTQFNFPISWLRFFMPRIDCVVSGSESVSESIGRVLKRAVKVVPYGVAESASSFGGREVGRSDPLQFLYVGRLEPQKNPVRLIEAFFLTRQTRGELDDSIRLTIVGDGPLRPELEELCSASGLEDIVEFIGNVADLDRFFLTADYLVVSSDFEGLPIVLLRSLIDGLPSILTPFPAAIQVTQEFHGGLVASDFTSEALSRALVEVLDNPGLGNQFRDQLAQNGHKIRERYSIESMVREYDRLYADVVS